MNGIILDRCIQVTDKISWIEIANLIQTLTYMIFNISRFYYYMNIRAHFAQPLPWFAHNWAPTLCALIKGSKWCYEITLKIHMCDIDRSWNHETPTLWVCFLPISLCIPSRSLLLALKSKFLCFINCSLSQANYPRREKRSRKTTITYSDRASITLKNIC